MVNSLMYCSEQIVVPETFPNILKDYAKAAIRTQPYDLLRWSSAYFRCLAQNEPPPAKCRLEEDVECGAITKGYLRVLLDQVGKGFFISRGVLQKKWEGLCLPQDDLLMFLSVSRMLNWSQVHWLKLFAIMVGSLNESLRGTLTMLCELLTEDVEGGPARVPMWMFRTVYTFLAELDCSQEQHFVNGRKKFETGELEPETVMDNVPKVFSTASLKQQIMNECLQRYNEEYQKDEGSRQLSLKSGGDCVSVKSNASDASSSSSVNSKFQIAGKLGDAKQIIQKCGDFNSLILLLREAQGAKLHEYEGPHHISQANIEHAKRREATVQEAREQQAVNQEKNTKKFLHLESINMLRDVGPPWSWIHQFVSNNCANMSYNFVEEGSVASDVTPPESSDESFDFRREKPISSEETESDSHLFSTSTDNVDELIQNEKTIQHSAVEKKSEKKATLQNIINKGKDPDSKNEVDLSDASSIVSYINKDEIGVLLRGGARCAPNFSVEVLDQILRDAMQSGTVFENINEVIDFVRLKYKEFVKDTKTDNSDESEEPFASEEFRVEEDSAEESPQPIKLQQSEHTTKATLQAKGDDGNLAHRRAIDISTENRKEDKDKASSIDEDENNVQSANVQELDPLKIDTVSTLEIHAQISEPVDLGTIGEIENVFESCGMEADPKLLAKKTSDTMILGLVDKDVQEEMGEEEEEVVPSVLDITENRDSQGGYISDCSRDDITTPSTFHPETNVADFICGVDADLRNASEKRPDYECSAAPYPGIGKSVSEKTIHDFLTYLKFRSRSQKGMVFPRNFREDKCPKMFD